jgi:hypothetical protein
MPNKIREKIKRKARKLVGENLQQEPSELGESTPLEYIPTQAKIPVEIREVIFIKDTDFGALRKSFEIWCAQWD